MALFKTGDHVVVVKEDPDPVYGSGGGAYHRVGDRGVVAAGSGASSIRFFEGRLAIRVHFPERNHTWWAYEHELKRINHGLLDI